MNSDASAEDVGNTETKISGLKQIGNRLVRDDDASHAAFSEGELWILNQLPHEFELRWHSVDRALELMADLSSGRYYLRPTRRNVIVRLELEEDAVGLRLALNEPIS